MARRHRSLSIFYALALLATLGALWWGLGFIERSKSNTPSGESTKDTMVDERGEIPMNSDESILSQGEGSGAKIDAINAVAQDASQLLPESGGSNAIGRFWFTAEDGIYVEYRTVSSQTSNRMAFLVSSGSATDLAFQRQSLYALGEAGWELFEGKEVLAINPPRDLYEKNANGEWVRAN